MKKIFALILALVILLSSLSACSKKADTSAADAYLSMAQDFLDKNDVASAIDILNKGFTETKDARLSEKLVEIYAQRDNTKTTEPSSAETPSTTASSTKPQATKTPTTNSADKVSTEKTVATKATTTTPTTSNAPAATKAPTLKPAETKAPTTKPLVTKAPTKTPVETKVPTTKPTTPLATKMPITTHTHKMTEQYIQSSDSVKVFCSDCSYVKSNDKVKLIEVNIRTVIDSLSVDFYASATGGYGRYSYKYELYSETNNLIDTRNFKNDDSWYGLHYTNVKENESLKLIIKDNYGHQSEKKYTIKELLGEDYFVNRALDILNRMTLMSKQETIDLAKNWCSSASVEKALKQCTTDWNQNAINYADDEINSQLNSGYYGVCRKELTKHMQDRKFTDAEISYMYNNYSIDWNNQAAKRVEEKKSQSNYNRYSKSDWISLLEGFGFTHDQAVYGVEKNGIT